MSSNHGVFYVGHGKVEVKSIEYPELKTPQGKRIDHGVIIKPITTNICGSDQHMVRGRTTAPPALILGHEITGEVIECGSSVEFIGTGDLVSVPFNVACGRCRNCKERRTDVGLNVNPSRAGGAYGYVELDSWAGEQSEYVMVPYADWNLLRFPDRDQALGQMPVMKYNRGLMMATLHDRIEIAKALNVELIRHDQAPEAYQAFDSGVPKKFVIDPHQSVPPEARLPTIPMIMARRQDPDAWGVDWPLAVAF